MQPKALADFLEDRGLELLYRWFQAFLKQSHRSQNGARSVLPGAFTLIFSQLLGLLRGDLDLAMPIGHREVYGEDIEHRHLSDLLEILLTGERVLWRELVTERKAIGFKALAAEAEQLNAAFHRMLEIHVGEFCSDCEDLLAESCRQLPEQSQLKARTAKPLRDPLEHRSLAYLPPLQPNSTAQNALASFLRSARQEIVERWLILVDDHQAHLLRSRVESVAATISELLDEVISTVTCCTLHPPHLGNTPSPIDCAPNALHVILAGEEAIAGLLRGPNHVMDELWMGVRGQLNKAFHEILRKNVTSECARCRALLGASRNRLRSLKHRVIDPAPSDPPPHSPLP